MFFEFSSSYGFLTQEKAIVFPHGQGLPSNPANNCAPLLKILQEAALSAPVFFSTFSLKLQILRFPCRISCFIFFILCDKYYISCYILLCGIFLSIGNKIWTFPCKQFPEGDGE
jgi:hypothetical protein